MTILSKKLRFLSKVHRHYNEDLVQVPLATCCCRG